MEPRPPALGLGSLSCWTTREVPTLSFFVKVALAIWSPLRCFMNFRMELSISAKKKKMLVGFWVRLHWICRSLWVSTVTFKVWSLQSMNMGCPSIHLSSIISFGLPRWLSQPANAGDARNAGSIPGSGRSPGGGHGNPLWYSCLENPEDRGA